MSRLVLGRVAGHPDREQGFVNILSRQITAGATGQDFFFPEINTSYYSVIELHLINYLTATIMNPASLNIRFSTDGSTINSGANYDRAAVRYTGTATAAVTIAAAQGQMSFVLDAAATFGWESATGAGVRGVGGAFSWNMAGASEVTQVDWRFSGAGATTNFLAVEGMGLFRVAGPILGVRLTYGGGETNGRGQLKLWGRKSAYPIGF